MTVHRVVLSVTRVYRSGEPVPVEVDVDYCLFHAPDEES